MSALQQPIEIFVTYIEKDGPFLRLWAQLDRTQATAVERLILQLSEKFERGLGIPSTVQVGQLCCARYSDGVYYRARVIKPADITGGHVAVHFIDYGNTEVVSVRDIRSLEGSLLTRLASVGDNATEFLLAGVIPVSDAWDEKSLAYIRQALCYEELKALVIAQVGSKRLIRVFYNNEDFSQILIASKVGLAIQTNAQQMLIEGYYNWESIPPQFPGFTVPPPARVLGQLQSQAVAVSPVTEVRMETYSHQMSGSTPSVQETVRIFTSPVLELNSEHMVRVSHVEDGPSSFAVQLQAAEGMLSTVMNEINNAPAVPLTQPLMPGSVCLGRFTEDLTLCRAVVMAVLDDRCRLYYVDFGNSEILPYSEIFELPKQFINPKVMALRFSLAGLKNLTITDEVKSYFKELVVEKPLRLRVVAPEDPPIKQYGELHLGSTNVLDLLVKKMKEKEVHCRFPMMPMPSVGTRDSVRVSYVVNTSSFYVQLEINTKALKSVMLGIETICSDAAPFLKADQLEIGLPCCAQYSEDGKWYRAKILSFSSSLVEVMYVDYGNSDLVPLSSLKSVDPSLVKMLNPQAIPCSLNGFQDNVNEDLAVTFENMILDKILTMVVVGKLQNDKILVELYSGPVGSFVSVGAQLSNRAAQESNRMQTQLSMHNSPAENNGWNDTSTESSSEIYQGTQCEKKQVWGGGMERSNQQEPSSSSENVNEWRSFDRGVSGGGKPKQNKYRANWREEDGDGNARGKWRSQRNEERSKGEKWSNSRGDNIQQRKSRQDDFPGSDSGNNHGDFKKSSNQDEDDGNQNRGGSWKMEESGGQQRKYNNGKDDGGRRKRWQDNSDDTQRRSGPSDSYSMWRSKKTDESNSGLRRHKPWGNHEQSGEKYGFQKKNMNENVNTEVGGGNMQPATQKWNGCNAQPTVPGSIPEAMVKTGDTKPVEVVFLASPEEFCVQITSESSKLTSVMEGIASTYGSDGGDPVPRARLRTGTACVAPYSEDGILYRGIIESVNSNSAVVLFCDYGNRQEVTLDQIKDISNEYLSLPIQGLACKLKDAKPHDGVSWSEDEILKFTTLTEEKKLQAYFASKTNGVYEVVLTDIESGSKLNEEFCVTGHVQNIDSKVGDGQSYELALPDQRYLVQNVIPETEHEVTVTWFVNPEEFYCQMLTSQLAMKDMMDAIQSAYYSKPPLTTPVEISCPVIAKFVRDGVLYRAEVKEVLDTSSLIVQFVDYGNCDIVKKSDVWHIEARFMTLPKQALLCSMKGVKAPDSQWSRGDMGVDKHFEAGKFRCTFHNYEECKYSVSLMSEEGKSIADKLLEDGLAVAQVHSETVKTADASEMLLDFSLLPGQNFAAHITCVESVSKFFVHLNPTLANRIQALVDEYVQNPENIRPVELNSLAANSLCLASEDGVQWYRGEIVDFSTTGACIKLIDVGSCDQISLDKVLVIPPDLTNYYAQAVECHVTGTVSLTVAPNMDVILLVDSVDRKRLFVTVFSMEDSDHKPLSEVDPVCPLPVMSKKVKVWVSHVEGPDSIWLQRVCDADTLADLIEKMYMFYMAEGNGVNMEVSEGKLCAAESVSDNQWYRGKILSVNVNNETCTVLFIDYGNSETIPVAHVKELDASLFIPNAQAICTALAVKFEDYEKITSELLKMTSDKEFTAVFGTKKENKWLVDLFVDRASVSKQLVDLGLVKEFEAHLFQSKLKAGTCHSVFVSHFDSPSSFWVQKSEDSQEILTFQVELQMAADSSEKLSSVPPVGTMCIGMFAEAWYRAVVLENNLSLVTVRFIDYGNVDNIDIASEDLKALPENLQDIPKYAEECTLLGNNEGYEFHDGAAEKMEVLVGSTEQPATIHVFTDGDTKHVDLISADGKNVLLILVNEGLVTKTALLKEDCASEIPDVDVQVMEEISSGDTQVTEEEATCIDTEVRADISTVSVSHIKSPSEFWIQYKSDASQIKATENRLLEAESFLVLDEIVEGTLCAAKFTDGQWYRAKVTHVTNEIEVFSLDYGNHSISTELRSLPEDLLSVPPLAKCCSFRLPDGMSEWSTSAKEMFIQRAGGGCTQFQVNILEEGDCAFVSLLQVGQRIEDELLNLCLTVDEVSSIYVKPSKLCVRISHVISSSEFWIQFEDSLSCLDEIGSKLAESEGFPLLKDTKENVLCVAQFPEDGRWYRACIMSHSDDWFVVMHVDFGSTATSTELRELPDELKDIPPLAKKCSLSIFVDTLECSEAINDAFMDTVGEANELFEIEIVRDGDPALISMWHNGQKVEDELLKIGKTENISAVENETLGECPHERKEDNDEEKVMEVEDSSENSIIEQEIKDGCSSKHSEGVDEMDIPKNYDEGTQDEIKEDKIEEKEEYVENVANVGEQAKDNIWDQNVSTDIVCDVQNTALDVKEQTDDSIGSDFTSQKTEECKGTMSTETIKIGSCQEGIEHASSDLNPCTVMRTDDESGESKVSMKNSHERPLALHLQRTHHTEELVKEISIEMKTPNEAVSTTLANMCTERTVPATINVGLSKELLHAGLNRSASLELMHKEEIVPVCTSQSKLIDIDNDKERTKSAPSTPLVSRPENFLQRMSSCDGFWQKTPSSPKLTLDDKTVPGSVSRMEYQEDIRPFTLKLPHAKKIVPGSISRGISDEEFGYEQLEAVVVEAHEHTEQKSDETSVTEKADPANTAAV